MNKILVENKTVDFWILAHERKSLVGLVTFLESCGW